MTFIPSSSNGPFLPANIGQVMNLASGMCFRCDNRNVRLERVHDDGTVELLDLNTQGLLRIKDPETGECSAPTVSWMCEAYASGILYLTSAVETAAERQGRFALLDPSACQARDSKALWRFSLAWRISADGVRKTDADYRGWLNSNFGKEERDNEFPRPSPSALRRWVRSLENGDKRPGCLVSQAGRPRGRSQLESKVDALLQEAALWYWTRPRASIADAQAWLDSKIKALNAGIPDVIGRTEPYTMPSKEALRKRINNLRCYDTVSAKEGPTAAAKQFQGSGEPMVVDHILDVAYMDATTLEQLIGFDKDWLLPACKVRLTCLMDTCSHAILGYAVYAGPNRYETSAEAILSCMVPTDYSAEALQDHPELQYIFGRPAAILPDNEKALVGPSSLPSINEAGFTLLLPPIEMPTAKAALERFFKSLKGMLAQLPGTIIDPKHAKDLDYDPLGATSLTLPDLRDIVTQAIATHNVSPSTTLDDRSPLQVWMHHASKRATPAFENIDEIRRRLGRTFEALLTRDGIELDGIRYRDADKVTALLSNLAGTADRRSQRKDGSATVKVKVRRCDGNLDSIDVYDAVINGYVTLPSTQPEYTDKLSAWEHQVFTKRAKERRETFKAEKDRLTSRARTIREIDRVAPQVAFQQRRQMAALYQSLQVKQLAGKEHAAFPSDAIIAPQSNAETLRKDEGLPASATQPGRERKARFPAPPRPEGYGGVVLEDAALDFDFDAVVIDSTEQADPETGVEPLNGSLDDDDGSTDSEA